jgi:glucuronoarabinoxylan endo-1,4-beta-xylanase
VRKALTRALALGSGLVLTTGLALTPGSSAAAQSAASPADTPGAAGPSAHGRVDWNGELQHIDGFGGAFAFHKAGSIQRLGEPLSDRILDMLFSKDEGIGLDIVRVMVGDGGIDEWGDETYDGPSETIMPAPGELVWDDPDWEESKDDFDHYQIWLMNEAKERGVDTVFASVWSPPAWMKENGSVIDTGEGPNRLRDDMYQEYADYLAEYVLGYAEHFDIEIDYISPTNEPDHTGGYSSSLWTAHELNVFVRDHLAPTFDERGVPAQIVLGEGIGFMEDFALDALEDPETRDHVDVVAAHAYTGLVDGATAPDPEQWTTSLELGKTIWQTEYMNQGEPQDRLFVNNTIPDGLRYATLIGNMVDSVDLNAYFWWWPASNSGADGSNLIRLQNDGSPQSGNPTETGQYRVFKRYYTFGHYSRFIDPGYVVLDADSHPGDDVLLTAYKDPQTEDFTLVAVNNSEEDQALHLDLDGFPADLDSVVGYRTSASENMLKLDPVDVADGTLAVDLRGSSVTTFVPEEFALPALPPMRDVFSTYPAEENDGHSPGLHIVETDDAGAVLTNIRHGTHVRYDNVNFADGSAAGFLDQMGDLQMHARVAPLARGGTIEVKLGDPRTGPVVGELDVPPAAESDETWITVSTDIDTDPEVGAYGFHDMYLVFDNHPSANTKMFDLDLAEFSD